MTPRKLPRTLAALALLTLAVLPALPAAAASSCSTLNLACATASGSGTVINLDSGCKVGDSLALRNCTVRWSSGGSATGALGGILSVSLRAGTFPTRTCVAPIAGAGCAVQSWSTDITYRLSCNAQTLSADIWADFAGPAAASEHISRSVSIPRCN